MLKLVQKDKYESISQLELFKSLNEYLFLNIYPILNQSFSGQIWVDNFDNPQVSYIYDSRKAHFLIGKVIENREALSEFVKTQVYPIIKKSTNGSTFIYSTNWDSVNEFGKFDIFNQSFVIPRKLFKFNTYNASNFDSLLSKESKKFKLVEVSKEILDMDLKNTIGLKEELKYMWDNIDNFFKFGFGVCAITGDSLAGWCLGEYFSEMNQHSEKKIFGIGIETYPEFQKKGIATAMTCSLVKKGLGKGYTIYWDCSADNSASIRTALKSGFELLDEYRIIFVPPSQ